ncbi:hypothetical protein [Haloarchaeobius iranensis]|uniref:PIN domain-containing protein n=1 Tax=Haloarchaeobius iranensis TaxID=996166 RepID=A0A1H0B264_9EURY|nr:hypothetical protein [Haloarchaeobius iranensis]SDN39752.1 hypothetical protein SAMN05192554_1333 [Haloarchaeobius iranensis]
MIVADTSALISVATVDLLETLLTEYDVRTTETVLEGLTDTAQYDDSHGRAAQCVLDNTDQMRVHDIGSAVETSRIDIGEGNTAALANELDAEFIESSRRIPRGLTSGRKPTLPFPTHVR